MQFPKIIIYILLLSSFYTSASGEIIDDSQVRSYINKITTVCGTVSEIKLNKNINYINLGGNYPHQKISLVIWSEGQPQFMKKMDYLKKLNKKKVCASGKITVYKNRAQMILKNSKNLNIIN